MPTNKAKANVKASTAPPTAVSQPPPAIVDDRSRQRYHQTNPAQKRFEEEGGFAALTPAEKKTLAHTKLILPVSRHQVPLSNKAEREFWKQVAREGLPIRTLSGEYDWGRDAQGREVGGYSIEEFGRRTKEQATLTALDVLHRRFLRRREQQQGSASEEDLEEEKRRRRDMAYYKGRVYKDTPGALANDPAWDDVVPIPQNEPADALAKIAYPDDYVEAISYLRAVMAAEEMSPRALLLTEKVIAMNPSHYTVWLYRFKIVKSLSLSVPDEIAWLNDVAMDNLKSYQIWHHRQLLLDHYYPTLLSSPDGAEAVKAFARSEIDFTVRILQEDTKNYHVWSYRQYLVSKTGLWGVGELLSTQNMIEEDLRNNSAWSHRFFLVFSDPGLCTPNSPLERDDRVPAEIIEREAEYAKEKILLAPQNQSAWHYLRGVLVKGGRGLESVAEFAEQFFDGLGEGEGAEKVRSSHALDLMSEVYAQRGEVGKARVCLQRLGEKWDPVREGYWRYRLAGLEK